MASLINEKIIKQIADLRYKGLSHARVAEQLGISQTTVRAYGPKDAVTKKLRYGANRDSRFTDLQMKIAITALENIEKNGIIPQSYWHKDAV